jgi:mono/diheme cytochrome c family protein
MRLDAGRIGRGLAIGLLSLTALVMAAYAGVHVTSQRSINRTYEAPLLGFAVDDDPSTLAEGERLARITGCIGCHGPAMEGRIFMDERWLARIVAPDLRQIVREQSDAELERVIRRGVMRNGRSVWIMPSPMLYHLSDEDLGAILFYIRSVEPDGDFQARSRMRIGARVGVLVGLFHPLAEEIGAHEERFAPDKDVPIELGRYLAMIACTECHGQDLGGGFDGQAPDLRMAGFFQPTAFHELMREGVAPGGRELGVMGDVARGRFAHFTDHEIEALHLYLRSLGPAP